MPLVFHCFLSKQIKKTLSLKEMQLNHVYLVPCLSSQGHTQLNPDREHRLGDMAAILFLHFRAQAFGILCPLLTWMTDRKFCCKILVKAVWLRHLQRISWKDQILTISGTEFKLRFSLMLHNSMNTEQKWPLPPASAANESRAPSQARRVSWSRWPPYCSLESSALKTEQSRSGPGDGREKHVRTRIFI